MHLDLGFEVALLRDKERREEIGGEATANSILGFEAKTRGMKKGKEKRNKRRAGEYQGGPHSYPMT